MRDIIQAAYEFNSTSDAAWGLQARRLKRAADAVFAVFVADADRVVREEVTALEVADNLEMLMPASMLYGLALENVLKALIIQKAKPTVANLAGLFGGGSGHNLLGLAN